MNKTNKFTNYIPAPINLTNTYYSRKPMEPFINFLEYNIKKKKYMWSQIYAHLLYGLTLSDPFPYFQQYNIKIEGKLHDYIKDWVVFNQFKSLQYRLNQEDIFQDQMVLRLFPQDTNIGWIYDSNNLFMKLNQVTYVRGVSIQRKENLPSEDYSIIKSKKQLKYTMTTKEQAKNPFEKTNINVYKMDFIANRYLIQDGKEELDEKGEKTFQKHTLQIEEIAGFRIKNQKSDYWISDIDNILNGNPHVV